MYLPLLNYVVLDGLAIDFANIEDFTFVQRLHLSEDLVRMCSLNHNKMSSCASPPSTMFTHGEAIYLLLLIDSLFLSHVATTIKSIPLSSRQTNDTIRGPTLN